MGITSKKYLCFYRYVYKYCSDHIESFINQFNLEILILDMCNHVFSNENFYIFINDIPLLFFSNNRSNNKIFLLNIEQLTRQKYFQYINQVLDYNIKCIDYSTENINYIKRDHIYYLPYQFNSIEIDKLKLWNDSTVKEYDVAFIGNLSPKRKHICVELEKRGLKVLLINNSYGDERDKETAKAKILLNIHYANDYDVYESLRCDRWLFAGMLIVSESSMQNFDLDINDLIIFEKYEKLVDKVVDVAKNYDKYYQDFISKQEHIEKVKQIRHEQLLKINELFDDNNIIYARNTSCLRIYSANWNSNFRQESYLIFEDQIISLRRGFNVIGSKNNNFVSLQNFDTYERDLTIELQKFLYNMYETCEYEYLILVTHDDAVARTNPELLQNNLTFLNCQQLKKLKYRGAYLLVYCLKDKTIKSEIYDNEKSIYKIYNICNRTHKILDI